MKIQILYCNQPLLAEATELFCPHHEGAGAPIPSGWGGLIYGIRWRGYHGRAELGPLRGRWGGGREGARDVLLVGWVEFVLSFPIINTITTKRSTGFNEINIITRK